VHKKISIDMNNVKFNKQLKTSKGYRLKETTHSLIEKIQLLIKGSKDTVISRAVKIYYKQIRLAKKNSAPDKIK
jgi:hypothetical protein